VEDCCIESKEVGMGADILQSQERTI